MNLLCVCVCVFFTQVVVFRDSCSCPGARSLLGEVVAELHDAVVLFQHFSDLHLNTGSQLLSLEHRWTKRMDEAVKVSSFIF